MPWNEIPRHPSVDFSIPTPYNKWGRGPRSNTSVEGQGRSPGGQLKVETGAAFPHNEREWMVATVEQKTKPDDISYVRFPNILVRSRVVYALSRANAFSQDALATMSLGTARKAKIRPTMDSTIDLGLRSFRETQPWYHMLTSTKGVRAGPFPGILHT